MIFWRFFLGIIPWKGALFFYGQPQFLGGGAMGVPLTLIKVVLKKNHEMGGTMLAPLWETQHTVAYGSKLC